jgi:ABC-type multidrug transport system fused ATPase/permease subunit
MKDFRSCMRGLRKMFRPIRWQVLVRILIGLVRIAASLAFVWVCKALVDIATGNLDADIRTYVWILVGIMAVQLISNVGASYWESLITVKAQNNMRYGTFGHVIRSRWNGRETFHSGDTVNRLEEDIRVVTDLLCSRVPDVAVTLCQLVAASIFLTTMAPNLTWLLLLLMLVAVLGSRMFFKTFRKLTALIRARDSEIQGYMQENLQNRILVLTLTGAERVLTRLGWLQEDVLDNTVKRLNYNAVARSFMSLGFMAGYGSAFLWGVFGIRDGVVTYGMMTAFLQLVGQIQRPIAEIARHIPAFIHALTSVERLMELDELPLEEKVEPVKIEGAPEIELRDVTFAYEPSEPPVLEDFSYTFKAGRMTAIAGITGPGKSTLTKLILALLQPQKGEILLNGTPVCAGTRCNFMYVPQGNSLMSGTIRENLQLADASVTKEEMREALRCAAAEFVFDLPAGLDTVCSEKGAGLSEGQAQRIAIARGLLQKGGVLILDEATSAVDAVTEQRLLSNLASKYKGAKTIIFISHREAVTSCADEVLSI